MNSSPGVDFFVNFHDLNPFTQRQCIYFTKKGARCKWTCHENPRARLLHQRILASNSINLSTDDIIEYILCNCCTYDSAIDPFEKVEHRDWIEDAGLVIPLANRWRREILARLRLSEARTQITKHCPPPSSAPEISENSPASTAYSTSAVSTPDRHSVTQTPITDPSYYSTRNISSFERTLASLSPQASPTPAPRASVNATITRLFGSQVTEGQISYGEASPEASAPSNRAFSLEDRYSQPLESEFRPHMARHSSKDTVSRILRRHPQSRDDETGCIYIFDRDGSPGHVKIGWTAKSVQQRLEDWSKHGYTPRLLFESEWIPNAQRVETLTHYELIASWRRELKCRALDCTVKHQEWFEVSQERAKKVVGDWVQFVKEAKPFDNQGYLKEQWVEKLDEMDAKGEAVTSARMLACHQAVLHSSAKAVEYTDPAPPTQSVRQESVAAEPEKVVTTIRDSITHVFQKTLEAFKKESMLAHQEFMKDLRSTQDQFIERLVKSMELIVEEPSIPKPVVKTAKPPTLKRRIKVRLPKPKAEWVISPEEKSALPASKQTPSPGDKKVSMDESQSPSAVTKGEKLTAAAQQIPALPVSKDGTNFEVNLADNFNPVNNSGKSSDLASAIVTEDLSTSNLFSPDGSLFAKEDHDPNETLSAKSSDFKTETSGHAHNLLCGKRPVPKGSFSTETKVEKGERSFDGAVSMGTKGLFGGITSTEKSRSLFDTNATSQELFLFGKKSTSEESGPSFGTKTTPTENSLFAKAMPTVSPLFDSKATSISLFGTAVTPKQGSSFSSSETSTGGSVFGGISTSEGVSLRDKPSSTGGPLFGNSIATTQSLLFRSDPPSSENTKTTSAFPESFSFSKTASPFAAVPTFSFAASSTSKSPLFATKATLTTATSMFATLGSCTTSFAFGRNANTPSTHELSGSCQASFVALSSSVSNPQAESENSKFFSEPVAKPDGKESSVYSVNKTSKNEPRHCSKTPLMAAGSTTSSSDTVLTSSKTPSIFDSLAKIEFDGFKSITSATGRIEKGTVPSQKVSQSKQMHDKYIVERDASADTLSWTIISRTSNGCQREEEASNAQDIGPETSEEEDEEEEDSVLDEEEGGEEYVDEEEEEVVDEEYAQRSLETHINQEDEKDEGPETGAPRNNTLGEDQPEHVSDHTPTASDSDSNVKYEISDKTHSQQSCASSDSPTQSQKEEPLISEIDSTVLDPKQEHGIVTFCESGVGEETITPLVPKAETVRIVETVTGTASILDNEVKKELDVTVVAMSEVLSDTELVREL